MIALASLGVLASFASTSRAHHSFAAAYDILDLKILEGIVTAFDFTDPHSFIFVEVSGESWELELPARWALARRGFTEATVRAGDQLLVVCNPARDGSSACGLGQRGGFYRGSDDYLYGVDPRDTR